MLEKKFKRPNVLECVQAVYTGKSLLPVSGRMVISPLTKEHADTVLAHYHAVDDAGYVLGRIESGEMFGAFLNGKLAGFVGFHEEGTFGLLEVLPEYRRMGVGSELESYAINLHLQKGWTPFCQVLSDNEKSLGLQRKLGLELSQGHVYWLF